MACILAGVQVVREDFQADCKRPAIASVFSPRVINNGQYTF